MYRILFLIVVVVLIIGCGKDKFCQKQKLIQYPIPFYQRTAGSEKVSFNGIETARFKLIRNRQQTWLLYDKLIDPSQLSNLAGLDEYTFIQLDLEKQLQQLLGNACCVYIANDWRVEWCKIDTARQNKQESTEH